MKLTNRLKETYGSDVPIFIDEVKKAMSEYSTPYVFRCLKEAVTQGELIRYDESIYYIPTETIFGKSALNPYTVIEKKYLMDGNKVSGFYSGWTLLNVIGGTRQVPNVLEIVTNKESMKAREATLGKQRLILRKPKYGITTENEKILQIMELANQFEFDEEGITATTNYAKTNNVGIKDLLRYSEYYPAKAIKNLRDVLYELA
jgi:prophage maintenance system killer protein